VIPKHYIDFEALSPGDGILKHDVLTKIMHVLHGAFGSSEGKFAVAFPEARAGKARTMGGHIRVFAGSPADIYALIDKVRSHHVMRDHAKVGMPKDVPENFSGKWKAYRRLQSKKRDPDGVMRFNNEARTCPYLEMRSSSGQTFPLRIAIEDAKPQHDDCHPSSYGLAAKGDLFDRQRNYFSVPDIG